MKNFFADLVFLPILFTITLSAPVERGDHAQHRPSFRHGHLSLQHESSHQILAAVATRPPSFTFKPIYSMDDFLHVEYGTPIQEASTFWFSATLSKLALDDEIITTGRFIEANTQPLTRSHETRHVIISISDSPMRALKQKGVSQDIIPHYVCQNVHVTDPASGDQYQLVPNDSLEKSASIDSDVVMITLKLK